MRDRYTNLHGSWLNNTIANQFHPVTRAGASFCGMRPAERVRRRLSMKKIGRPVPATADERRGVEIELRPLDNAPAEDERGRGVDASWLPISCRDSACLWLLRPV